MKQRLNQKAFSIVEVLIVLVVTSALFVSAVLLISGQQQKTQFSQAIRDIESQISDVINDVSTGFYPSSNNIDCQIGAGGKPKPVTGSKEQGSSEECIFIGKVMQFGLGTNGEGFNIYTVVGRRKTVGGKEVQNLNEAMPTAVAPSSADAATADNTDQKTLLYGLNISNDPTTNIKYMKYNSSGDQSIGSVGFFSTFGSYDSSSNLATGTPTATLIPVSGTLLNNTSKQAVDKINLINNSSPINPSGGVTICFDSGGTNQHGTITIGNNGRQLSTSSSIGSGKCKDLP